MKHIACPAWLPLEAKRAWRELAPLLSGMQVLTSADKSALVMLCDAWAEWRSARDEVIEKGETYTVITEAGSEMIRPRPEVAIAADAWKRIKAMLVEFGMTPAARSRITVPDNSPHSVWDELKA